jgi:hypothetical protein
LTIALFRSPAAVLRRIVRLPRKACLMHKSLPFLVCISALLSLVGCEHMVENRVVQRFAESIQEHDLEQMKAEASSKFEEQVVQGDDIFKALKLLDLPEGMPKITSVKNIRREKRGKVVQKRVYATIGPDHRKIIFMLKPDGISGRWVVDDLFLSKSDLDNNRSVAARLNVLLGVQEALDAWKSGSRDKILAAATPEFQQALVELTPLQMSQFAKKITAGLADATKIMPNERIGDETAELAIAKLEAQLVMTLRRDDKRWRLDDMSVKARRTGDDIASARLVAGAMSAALRFETAYRQSDKIALRDVCTPRFYEGCLASADVTTVRLPESGPGLDGFDIKLEEKTATFVVPAGSEWLKISLAQQPIERMHAAPRFLVDEVTIYDQTQDKRLSALFTARATLDAFCAAHGSRDLKAIKNYSTHDFNERVWDKAAVELLGSLPMAGFSRHRPKVLQLRFEGSLTEIMVEQGSTPVTYRLRDENGRILVDDLLSPSTAWPESLKASAEVLLPLLCFRDALRQSQMPLVLANASYEFSRIAWEHFEVAPKFDVDPESYFRVPLTLISRTENNAKVIYGDERFGAHVELVRERGQFAVDDVTLVSGRGDEQRIGLKKAIRTQLAHGEAGASAVSSEDRRGGLFLDEDVHSRRAAN